MRTTFPSLVVALAVAACSSGASTTSTTTGSGGSSSPASSSSGAMGGGSSSSTMSTGTGGVGGKPLGTKIDAPDSTWTWVPFDDAFCADGSKTGIGVNLSSKSSRVVMYLEGGGACWSEATCYTLMTAANFSSGYGATSFAQDAAGPLALPGGFFDRTDATNPFKDYSYVYVPYCTGDIHAGNNVATYGAHKAKHVGFANVTAYLDRLVPTFPDADRVYITGSSAGGFGALYNWWQTQQAFGKVRVDLIDDSGTPMPADIVALGNGAQVAESAAWNLPATLPPGCTGCKQNLDALLGFYIQAFPNQQGALLSYTQDTVLPGFAGITTAQFTMGLDEELAVSFAPGESLKAFVVDAPGHVLWFKPMLASKTVTLQQFLTQMVTDDPAWASVTP